MLPHCYKYMIMFSSCGYAAPAVVKLRGIQNKLPQLCIIPLWQLATRFGHTGASKDESTTP
jgi:hypothetical protein